MHPPYLVMPISAFESVESETIGSLFVSCCPNQTERTRNEKESKWIYSKLQWRGNQTG